MSIWNDNNYYIKIDGVTYQVAITSLKRKADILDKYAERSEDGILHREVIGTYHNYTLAIGIVNDLDLYNTLFDVLSAPVESHMVELPHDHVQFEGYFSSVQDEIDKVTEYGTRYKGLTCNLISTKPSRITEFGVDYNLSDTSAANDASFVATSQQDFADTDLIVENIIFNNQMTLEHNYCVLDGQQEEFDDDPDNVSYFSSVMSGSDGTFETNPTLTIEFDSYHSSLGLTFLFVETYPSQMRIQWYQDTELIFNNVFDVTSLEQVIVQPVENYNKIVITFLKTAIPYRYIKLAFLRFGIILEWHEKVIKDATLVQQQDIIMKQLPISTLNFSIVDLDGDTNIGNSKGIQQYFQRKQMMFPYEIINGEKINLGKFYLDKFSNTKALTKISAMDMIGLLDTVQFEAGAVYNGVAAGTIIAQIMTIIDIDDYEVDLVTAAQLLYGTIKPTTCRNALQQILFACGSVIDTTDASKVVIRKTSPVISYPINKDIKFSTEVTKTAYVSGVKVKYSSYSADSEQEPSEITKGLYPAGTNRIVYSEPYFDYVIDEGTITASSPYYVEFILAEETSITITAKRYEAVENSVQTDRAFIEAGESENVVEFSTTLCNYTTAKELSSKLLKYYDNRLELKVKYLASSNMMDYRHSIENIRPQLDNYIAQFTQRSLNLTGGMIDNAKMIGYFDDSSYEYYATDSNTYLEYVADDDIII